MNDATERTALYRLFSADDELLYIGISKSFGARWRQHAASQSWWGDVDHQSVHWFPSRDAALAAEASAIKAEHPRHNVIHAVLRTVPENLGMRAVELYAQKPCVGGWESYDLADMDIIAPGTYEVTFTYDPSADDPVGLSECKLVHGDDDVSRHLGGKVRPRIPESAVPAGKPWGYRISLDEAYALNGTGEAKAE